MFCRKQLLEEKQIYRVQLALEELLCHLLLPNLPEDQLQAELVLSHSGKDGTLTITTEYAGGLVSREKAAENELSMTMLTAVCRELHWKENRILLQL